MGESIVTYLGTNIRALRNRKKLSQEILANELTVSRAKLNSYENGITQNPPIEFLLKLSDYFNIGIDYLIKHNLNTLSELQIRHLEEEKDFIKGSKLRILTGTVDKFNRDNIELVPFKAKAGYAAGYSDPEFIASLPTFQLPFLSPERKYRAFQIDGDSMLPIKHGSYVIGEYVLNWEDIKSGQGYIVITQEEGAVFKIIHNNINKTRKLQLISLNPLFQPYEVGIGEVREVWKFINYFSNELPDAQAGEDNNIMHRLLSLENEIKSLRNTSN